MFLPSLGVFVSNMPNATCFLFAYVIVLILEILRWMDGKGRVGLSKTGKSWLYRSLMALATIALLTHSLYLLDRIFLSAATSTSLRLVSSWHDWAIVSAWALACSYLWLLLKRSESLIGLFVLPWLVILVAVSLAVPREPLGDGNSATMWRLVHGVSMTIGTMLVTLGFTMAIMYLIQANRLKNKRPHQGLLRLPSLEYLQSFGSFCLLLSAASIGFGLVSGVIMNLVRDGQVNWTDRGILFSGGLFVWLVIASWIQWQFAKRGKGSYTAWMNVLSFVIVGIAVLLVMSAPHGETSSKPLTWNPSGTTKLGGGAL